MTVSHLVRDLEELKVSEEQLYVRQASTGQLTLRHLLVLKEALSQVHSTCSINTQHTQLSSGVMLMPT